MSISNGNEAVEITLSSTPRDVINYNDNVQNMSPNVCYESIKNAKVSKDDIQNISTNICYETPTLIKDCKSEVQNFSSNICYEATEIIISKKNECYVTLKEE